jgi:hypothetical protein
MHGSYEFWNSGKVLEFWRCIFQTLKVLEFCQEFWIFSEVLENLEKWEKLT